VFPAAMDSQNFEGDNIPGPCAQSVRQRRAGEFSMADINAAACS
jgi:hypothetical protein